MTVVNVDPTNPAGAPEPLVIRMAGFTWVRMVSHQGAVPYGQQCQAAGLFVLAVITEESGGYLCPADAYQIGNEPDVGMGHTPNAKSPADFVAWWNLYRGTYPALTMIGPGLASGDPHYWRDVQAAGGLKGAAGMAVHPYGKDWVTARGLLQAYRAITPTLPVWLTEWSRPAGEIPAFKAMLRANTVADAFFCWSDGMVQGFGCSPEQRRAIGAN